MSTYASMSKPSRGTIAASMAARKLHGSNAASSPAASASNLHPVPIRASPAPSAPSIATSSKSIVQSRAGVKRLRQPGGKPGNLRPTNYLQPVGTRNAGNTCYCNATLAAWLCTPAVLRVLLCPVTEAVLRHALRCSEDEAQASPAASPAGGTDRSLGTPRRVMPTTAAGHVRATPAQVPVLQELHSLFARRLSGTTRSAKALLQAMAKHASWTQWSEQHDAHEFSLRLLMRWHEESKQLLPDLVLAAQLARAALLQAEQQASQHRGNLAACNQATSIKLTVQGQLAQGLAGASSADNLSAAWGIPDLDACTQGPLPSEDITGGMQNPIWPRHDLGIVQRTLLEDLPEQDRRAFARGVLPTVRTFESRVMVTITCQHCGYARHRYEEVRELQLPLPERAAASPHGGGQATPGAQPCATPTAPSSPISVSSACSVPGVPEPRTSERSNSACDVSTPLQRPTAPTSASRTRSTRSAALACRSNVQAALVSSDDEAPVLTSIGKEDSTLSVPPIPLEHLLQAFQEVKVLPDLKCEHCHERGATSQSRILQLPRVLVLQLVRFEYDPRIGAARKLRQPVMFPHLLDITQLCAPDPDQLGSAKVMLPPPCDLLPAKPWLDAVLQQLPEEPALGTRPLADMFQAQASRASAKSSAKPRTYSATPRASHARNVPAPPPASFGALGSAHRMVSPSLLAGSGNRRTAQASSAARRESHKLAWDTPEQRGWRTSAASAMPGNASPVVRALNLCSDDDDEELDSPLPEAVANVVPAGATAYRGGLRGGAPSIDGRLSLSCGSAESVHSPTAASASSSPRLGVAHIQPTGAAASTPLSSPNTAEHMYRGGVVVPHAKPLYQLHAVVCHSGHLAIAGHYTTYGKVAPSGKLRTELPAFDADYHGACADVRHVLRTPACQVGETAWRRFNDDRVRAASEADVFHSPTTQQDAYILYYQLHHPCTSVEDVLQPSAAEP